MISANVVEELVGAGWVCDDVRDHFINGQQVKQELWRRGKTVEIRHLGRVLKVLSGSDDCLQSVFARFEGNDEPFVVIREETRLRIYSAKGEEFLVHLPIPLKNMWKSKFGLVLEAAHQSVQKDDPPETPMPNLLALHHPLDDFTRVVSKKSAKSRLVEWKNQQNRIIMLSESPSLVVSFNRETGLHSVWQLRKCTEEDLETCPDVIGTPMMRHSKKTSSARLTPLFDTSKLSKTTPNISCANMSSTDPRPTPNVSSTNISMEAKSGKPTPNASFAKLCRSPSQARSSRMFISSLIEALESSRNPEEPLPPDISLCLEHLWSESLASRTRCREGVANKVFIGHDLIARSYLCFLLKPSLLVVQLHSVSFFS